MLSELELMRTELNKQINFETCMKYFGGLSRFCK